MPIKSFKEQSKHDWGRDLKEGQTLDTEELQLGCLQRIADGVETISGNWRSLIGELHLQKDENRRLQTRITELNRQVSSLKGVITKLKKKQAK